MDDDMVTVKFKDVPVGADFWYSDTHLIRLQRAVLEIVQDEGSWIFGPEDEVRIEEIPPAATVSSLLPPPAGDPDFDEVFPFNVFP